DGNFCATAGIAELLLQSHDCFVHLLPALPGKWQYGKVSGLKARGDFVVDIQWGKGKLLWAKVIAKGGGILPLKSPIAMKCEECIVLKAGAINPLLQAIDPGRFLDHKQEALPEFRPPAFYEYYIQTTLGEAI